MYSEYITGLLYMAFSLAQYLEISWGTSSLGKGRNHSKLHSHKSLSNLYMWSVRKLTWIVCLFCHMYNPGLNLVTITLKEALCYGVILSVFLCFYIYIWNKKLDKSSKDYKIICIRPEKSLGNFVID